MPKQKWELRGNKLAVVTPAVKEQVEEVGVERLDREIQRVQRRKGVTEQRLAAVQAELDKWTTKEAELLALRAQLGD
jgi:hypothetical protein